VCLNDTKVVNVYLKHFHSSEFRAINVGMDNEKYITIKELAELKGVSTRAIRLSKGKYITREITVKGGKSFEILLSSIEPELQEKYYSKTIETLRDLHDETGIPIVLVGMSLAKHKLKKHTHLFDRISEIYQYTEFEYSDIKQIVDEISEVDMTKEVISVIHQKAKSFRKIVEMINTLENIALVNGIKLIDKNIIQEVFR